jgi:hypothetical protein
MVPNAFLVLQMLEYILNSNEHFLPIRSPTSIPYEWPWQLLQPVGFVLVRLGR